MTKERETRLRNVVSQIQEVHDFLKDIMEEEYSDSPRSADGGLANTEDWARVSVMQDEIVNLSNIKNRLRVKLLKEDPYGPDK